LCRHAGSGALKEWENARITAVMRRQQESQTTKERDEGSPSRCKKRRRISQQMLTPKKEMKDLSVGAEEMKDLPASAKTKKRDEGSSSGDKRDEGSPGVKR
jgi:hypothetical protein